MTGDLGTDGAQVHAQAREVFDFWFGLSKEAQFRRDDALDRTITDRFGQLNHDLLASGAAGWRDDPATMLAAIIVLDQFSRNLHRGEAQAFAADGLAVGLTLEAIEREYDRAMPPAQRVFLYMPLMHAEDDALQDKSVATFEALGIEENAAFARDHRAVFRRFGRFPGRNAALGRQTTPEEQAYLTESDGGW